MKCIIYLYNLYNITFRLTNVIPERIIFVNRGITVLRNRELLCPDLNLLNAELNRICRLLALLGAHHILHVSRIRVNRRQVRAALSRFDYTSIFMYAGVWVPACHINLPLPFCFRNIFVLTNTLSFT